MSCPQTVWCIFHIKMAESFSKWKAPFWLGWISAIFKSCTGFCPSFQLSIFLFIHQSIFLHRSIYSSINQSASIDPSIVSIHPSSIVSIHQSIHPSTCLHLSIYSIHPSASSSPSIVSIHPSIQLNDWHQGIQQYHPLKRLYANFQLHTAVNQRRPTNTKLISGKTLYASVSQTLPVCSMWAFLAPLSCKVE